jgi:hypothetical protein
MGHCSAIDRARTHRAHLAAQTRNVDLHSQLSKLPRTHLPEWARIVSAAANRVEKEMIQRSVFYDELIDDFHAKIYRPHVHGVVSEKIIAHGSSNTMV